MKKSNLINKLLKHKIYNYLLVNGNKKTSEKLLIKSSKIIQKTSIKNYKNLIQRAIIDISPILQIKQIRRKRKQIKQFPLIVNEQFRVFLAIKFIIKTSSQKTGQQFTKKLAQQFLLNNSIHNNTIKQKKNIQEQALKLKKYAHYRWLS